MNKQKQELHCYDYDMKDQHNQLSKVVFDRSFQCSMNSSTAYNIIKRDFEEWTENVCTASSSVQNCNYQNVRNRYCDASTKTIAQNVSCQNIVNDITKQQFI